MVGVFAWVWLYSRFIRRLAEAKRDPSSDGVLAAALAASAAAYAVGMFFFDAFAFIQVTFLLYFILGLGASLLRVSAGAGVESRVTRRSKSSTPG